MRDIYQRIPQIVMILLVLSMPFIEISLYADSTTEQETVNQRSDESTLNNEQQREEVTDDQTTTLSSDEGKNEKLTVEPEDKTKTTHEEQTGSIQLTNITDRGNPIEGTEYTLYKIADDEDIDVIPYESIDGETYEVVEIETELTTDHEGKFKIDELSFGQYLLVETKLHEDFEAIDEPIEFNIDSKESMIEITSENKKIVEEQTKKPKETTDPSKETKTNDQKSIDQTDRADDQKVQKDQENSKTDKQKKQSKAKQKEQTATEDHVESTKEERSPIIPFVGDLRTDIDIQPYTDNILSGRTANFLLTLKTSGPRHTYEDAVLTVTLPDLSVEYLSFNTDTLSDLTIAGVTPTYNDETYQLIYNFGDDLKSGQTYEITIPIETTNGITPNGTELQATANLQATIRDSYLNQTETFDESDTATITVEASLDINITKELQRATKVIDGSTEDVDALIRGGNSFWDLKITIPKKEYGQLYLDPDEIIKITDTFTDGLLLTNDPDLQVREGPKQTGRDATSRKIWWDFDPVSLEDQEEATDVLFETYMNVQLRIENPQSYVGKDVVNEISLNAQTIDGESVHDQDNITQTIFDTPNPGGIVDGTVIIPNFRGPSDAEGGISNNNDDASPIVYDDALLGFRMQVRSAYHVAFADIDANRGDIYRMELKVDPNLDLEYLMTPGNFIYRPFINDANNVPLSEQPEFDIQVKIKGQSGFTTAVQNAAQQTKYNRSDLGLTDNDQVEEVRLVFTKMPAGTFSRQSFFAYFTPKTGYVGKVENTFDLYIYSPEGKEAFIRNRGNISPALLDSYRFSQYGQRREDAGKSNPYKALASPKSAQIKPPSDREIFVRTRVELLDENNGQVVPGDNTLMIHVYNNNESDAAIIGPQEGVVLLPKGVTVKEQPNVRYAYTTSDRPIDGDFEILDEDYMGTGQQLIKVTWNNEGQNYRLPINFRQRAYIDVEIAQDAPRDLPFEYYFYSKTEDIQPDPAYDYLFAQVDTDDLNGNGNSEEIRIKAENLYHIKRSYDLIADKKIRTTDDNFQSWNEFSKGIPGETVDYKLTLNNTYDEAIKRLTLIDVLPSIGDRAITNPSEARQTTFEPYLTGPIELSDKFDIKYTTTKDPKRKPLVDQTKYPDTTEQLDPDAGDPTEWIPASDVSDWSDIYAFKIELKEGETLAAHEIHEITFTMQLPKVCEVDQEIFDQSTNPNHRAAFNSFAVSTEFGQAIEPLQVGVYLDATGAIELSKVNESGEPLEGATFDLYKVGEDKPIKEGLTTDEGGLIQTEGLEYGDYYFKETKAPEGYTLGDETEFSFTIDRPGSFKHTDDQCEAPETITVINEKIPTGAVELFKTDENDNPLADAVFALYKEGKDEPIAENLTTTDEGVIQVDGLEFGDYYFVETKAPDQYVLDDSPIKFTIDQVGAFDEAGNPVDTVIELTMKNVKMQGSLTIKKIDADTGDPLEGATFELRDETGKTIDSGTTDAEGHLVFSNLDLGKYTLHETKAKEGYRLLSSPLAIDITADELDLTKVIENSKGGWLLPDVGGIGTWIFYALGVLMMVIPFIYLWLRKKSKTN